MENKMDLKRNYSIDRVHEQFYTGGRIKISDDGCYLFTTCESTVKVVEVSTLQTVHTIEEDEDTPTCFAVGRDMLVIAWRSLLLRQYNWKEGKCTRQWKGHIGPVMSMSFDPTSTLLATGSSDGIIKVWDCERQYCTHNLRDYSGVVSILQFHPTKLIIFSSASDNKIKGWDLKSSSCKYILDGHVSSVTSLTLSRDGKSLISGGRDQVINVWSVSNGERLKTLPVYESIEGLVTLPGHSLAVAAAGSKGVIIGWDLSTGARIGSSSALEQNNEFTDLQLCSTLKCIVGVASDNSIILYDTEGFSMIRKYIGYIDEVLDIQYTDKFIIMATNTEQIKLLDNNDGSCTVLSGHTETVMSVDVSSDGCTLVSGSKDNSVRLWRLSTDTYNCYAEGYGHTHSVGAVACARSCSQVPFVVSGSQDHTIKVWDTLELNQEDDTAKLSVLCTQIAHKKDINSLDVSPNNRLVVSGSQDKTAKLWRVKDLSLFGTLSGHRRGIWSVQFSHVDQCVLTGSADSTIRLWSIHDLSCLKTFEGHNTSVLKALFINKGMQFVSSDSNGVIKLWSIKSQECLYTMDKHTDRVWGLTAANDGESLFSGGADSLICQWKDVTKQVEDEQQVLKDNIVMREQDLMNSIHKKDFVHAVCVALSLDQPFRVLQLLKDMLDEGGMDGKFKTTIMSLTDDDRKNLLGHIAKWNTNSKHCKVAQYALHFLLKTTCPEQWITLEGFSEQLKGLVPYTERHFQRLSKLKQTASFIDYTWQCMKLSEKELPGHEEAMT